MRDRALTRLLVPSIVVALVGVLMVVAWQVHEGQRLHDGPVAIAWDKEACAHCHMHLSDRHFAVQLQTTSGDVVDFDDPGCFFSYAESERPDIHEVWFHHAREERWLSRAQVAFVPFAATPMDFGLGAVDPGDPEAMTYEQARERSLAKGHAGG